MVSQFPERLSLSCVVRSIRPTAEVCADFACVNGDVSATTAEKEPVVRSARQTHNRYGASSKKKSTHTGGRVILFVAGGCSDAELRAAYEVQGKADVVIGSTSILAPRDFLAELGRDSVL